jgi:hypothetical protein
VFNLPLLKGIIMKVHQLFTVSALALATTLALAGSPPANSGALTRAEVRQSVIEARKAGELIPAGEGSRYPRSQSATTSTLTRAEVNQEVRAARAAGELAPAGEGSDSFLARSEARTFSTLTREDVNAATLRARDAGELVPAGDADEVTLAHERAQTQYARARWLARHPASAFASSK